MRITIDNTEYDLPDLTNDTQVDALLRNFRLLNQHQTPTQSPGLHAPSGTQTLRKSKINLVKGVTASISIQHQQQQQQEQQQQIANSKPRRRRKKPQRLPGLLNQPPVLETADELGKLVTKRNLYKYCRDDNNPQDLTRIWSNLVGKPAGAACRL